MKKLAIISAIALSGFIYNNASAQIHVSIGVNLGGPVVVGRPVAMPRPVVVDYSDNYYYLPEVDAYYSVAENMYYYNNGYNWISAVYLPGAYRNYNWRNVRRIEIHANRPYLNHDVYRTRYNGNRFDWNRYDNRGDNRNWNNRPGNNHREWNRGNDNRQDWNRGNNGPDRNRRPEVRDNNRGNDNRGNQKFERPSQNDNRGRGNDNRPNFASNDGGGRRGTRS